MLARAITRLALPVAIGLGGTFSYTASLGALRGGVTQQPEQTLAVPSTLNAQKGAAAAVTPVVAAGAISANR